MKLITFTISLNVWNTNLSHFLKDQYHFHTDLKQLAKTQKYPTKHFLHNKKRPYLLNLQQQPTIKSILVIFE